MSACHYSWTRHALSEAFFLRLPPSVSLSLFLSFSFFVLSRTTVASAKYLGRSPFVDAICGINAEEGSGCLFGTKWSDNWPNCLVRFDSFCIPRSCDWEKIPYRHPVAVNKAFKYVCRSTISRTMYVYMYICIYMYICAYIHKIRIYWQVKYFYNT